MIKKLNLFDFNDDMDVGVRWAGLSILENANLLEILQTVLSELCSVGRNALLISEIRGK